MATSDSAPFAIEITDNGNFMSDAVMHADLGTTLGSVPSAYANHQMIRTVALHINLSTDMSFDLGAATTLVYAHPTLNDHTQFRPSWLTTANGWSATGAVGSIMLPDPLTASGSRPVPVHYYERSMGPGMFTFPGFRSAQWDEVLGHYVGAFLIPNGVTVSAIEPEIYDLVPNISAAYVPPALDSYYWDATPPSTSGTPTQAPATSWSSLRQQIEAASPGDTVQLANGTYTDQGLITVSLAQGTREQPIIVEAETFGSVILDGNTRMLLNTCSYIIVQGFTHTGDPTGTSQYDRPYELRDCRFVGIRNCKFTEVGNPLQRNFLILNRSRYMFVSNNDFDNHRSQWISIQHQAEADTDRGYSRVHHNHFFNRTLYDSSQGADGQSGGTPDAAIELNDLWDHNLHQDWNNATETEIIGVKSRGSIFANNVMSDVNGVISTRSPWGGLMFANRFFNTVNRYNRNCVRAITGQPGDVSQMVHALNWVDFFSDPNGFWNVMRVSADDTERFAANRTLVVGDIVLDGDDEAFKHNNSGSTNLVAPQNLRFEGLSCELSAAAVFNVGAFPLQATESFAGCVMHGTSVGNIANPAGNTFEDPGFQDRGDGTPVPNHASLSYGVNICFPGRLEGPTLPNVGTTW